MDKITNDFIRMRNTDGDWEQSLHDEFIIEYQLLFHDCFSRNGERFIDAEQEIHYPITLEGATKALDQYGSYCEKGIKKLKEDAASSGSNGEPVEGVDYSIHELYDKLWAVSKNETGDYTELYISFPDKYLAQEIVNRRRDG